jgi:hypothetical protein
MVAMTVSFRQAIPAAYPAASPPSRAPLPAASEKGADPLRETHSPSRTAALVGDEAAARSVTFVEIPSLEGGYRAFYNPGGPGPEPTPDVRYTAPGLPDLEPVVIALDDPMRVSRG